MPSQYLGYSIAFLAVAYYNYTTYQAALREKEQARLKDESVQPPGGGTEKQHLMSGGVSSSDGRV
jgi:hypothetical protein